MINKELEKDLKMIGCLCYCHFNFREFRDDIKMLEGFMQSKEVKDMFKIIKKGYNQAEKNIEKYNRLMMEEE